MKEKDIQFTNSVAMLQNRVSIPKYYFEQLPQDVRSLAFTISGLETARHIDLIKRSLDNAIEQGYSFLEWKNRLDTLTLKILSEARLETVYRTNTATVYNQSARYNAITSDVTPYLMYTAVNDERTRPEHAALDETIKRADSKFWDQYTPPLGYNCRCGTIPLSGEEAQEYGIDKKSIDRFPEIEDGFNNKKMGDIKTAVAKETERTIKAMPKGKLRDRFLEAQDSIRGLVDVWYSKNKSVFKNEG